VAKVSLSVLTLPDPTAPTAMASGRSMLEELGIKPPVDEDGQQQREKTAYVILKPILEPR
jgi:hypothetical protein